jgi:hypothetical protein
METAASVQTQRTFRILLVACVARDRYPERAQVKHRMDRRMQVGTLQRSYDEETGATKVVFSVDLVQLAVVLMSLALALVATSMKSTPDQGGQACASGRACRRRSGTASFRRQVRLSQ